MPRAHATVRVLIVDDNASFRRAARGVVELTPDFVVVAEAESGEAALQAVYEDQPDLVLMDVNLPGIDGLQASRRILAGNETRAPVILLLSTYDAADYSDQPGECGAVAYLTKAEFGSESLQAAWTAAIAAT